MNLVIFCTTMGHGGRDTYEETITSISDQAESLFSRKVLHLKTKPNQEDKAEEIKTFCSKFDIEVIETKADVVHHSNNHQIHSAEYFKDVFKVYSHPSFRKEEYSFWLEDDWVIKENGKKMIDACLESMHFLDENPDQLCVRFNSEKDFGPCNKDHFIDSGDIFTQGKNYTHYGPTFTFQPNISRTKEIYVAWKSGQRYLDQLANYHCELMSGDLLKNLTESTTPFSFYNPEKIYSQHIG
jgi:hypothetical protein